MAAAFKTLPTTLSSWGEIRPVFEQLPACPAAGVELHWQVDELEDHDGREEDDSDPDQGHRLEHDPGKQGRERDVRADARQRDDQVAHHQQGVMAGILDGMARLVGGDSHGRQRVVLVVRGREPEDLVGGVVMVGELSGHRLDRHMLDPSRLHHGRGRLAPVTPEEARTREPSR